MLAWIEDNQTILIWTTAISVLLALATLVAAPLAIVKIPDDYFLESKRSKPGTSFGSHHRVAAALVRVARNLLGWPLIFGGLMLVFTPGPGLIVAIIGVALADFPGKYRLQRWLITRGKVLQTANKLRARYGKPPLKVDGAHPTAAH